MNFSAQTSANQTQDIIDAKLDKRRKGVFAPPLGSKMIFFVDDLNMPAKETYGAQPPIELLRQFMDHGGWYERKEIAFRNMIDVQIVSAMGPPGGGRSAITCRLSRHFNTVSLTPFSESSMSRIFTTLLDWFLKNISGTPANMGSQIVKGTLEVFKTVSIELLPTPSKSHYTFNLRDIAKVIQGMFSLQLDASAEGIQRMWIHELQRIFQDRLINDEDRAWFDKLMDKVSFDLFKKNLDVICGDGADGNGLLLFADFTTKHPDPLKRPYLQVTDLQACIKSANDYLDEFNAMTTKPMSLVLFGYVVEHLCRVCRVLRQPRGHVLLIGVGGSGRQSITRLAAAIGEFDLVQIEISKSYDKNAWREDLKKIFRSAGVSNKRVVFMFTDSQIKFSSMLEDINNILNTGEVPNLFPSDELQQVLDGVLNAAKEAKQASTPAAIFKFFVSQCRKNLHMVLCFSPVGDGLRNRLRQFPSLVNCCTIDWFMAWPAEGLVAVAKQFLADVEIKPEIRGAVIQQCKAFQQSVREMTVKFQQQLRRINYVTPTSYLELIYTFKSLLGVKAGEVNMMRSRYDVGLQKLLGCADKVAIMQKELTDLQPVLVRKTAEVEEMLIVLAKDGAEAEEMEKKCLEEEAIATKSAGEAKELSDTCEAALAKALPALAAATDALKSLTKNDITEVKALKNPPKGVKVCMEAVCIMLEQTPDRVDSEDKKSKVDDYWKPAQKLLADSTFMQQLFNYDKDNIKKEVIKKVTPYIENPDFDPKVMEKVSKAANGLCKWVRAMHVYDEVAKIVEPKRIELKAAKESLKLMMDALAASKATLQAVQDKVAELKRKLQEAVDEKESLAFQVDKCGKQLARAEKLIGGLGGERVRWAEAVVSLTTRCENVCGDVLISSAVVAYLGIFTGSFREDAISQWIQDLKKMKIPCSDVVSLAAVLGDPVKIRTWNINGLPRDAVSIDNGIIMSYSRRWPLMIDPQGQANKWIRNTEKDKQMKFLKLSQSDFVRSLENAVEFGMPALLENVPETIDSILEPLLMKQVFKGLVTIGDKQCSYSPDFKLYITTKLPNPHYTPEISTKVVLVNFTITIGGLEDQLLGITVERERRELEEERQKLIVSNAGFKKQLKEIEDKILEMLSNASGDILEDEELINTLGASKQTSATIEVALKEAEATEVVINDTRQKYRPVATRGSILFFCISDLRNVEPMYQYSLNWFISLFVMAIQNAEQSSDVNQRVKKLIEFFSYLLYKNVCRSLFEKDKLMYSFLNTIRIMAFEKLIDPQELRFLFTGFTATDSSTPPPKPAEWIPERSWSELLQLCKLPAFGSVFADIQRDVNDWKTFYDSTNPQDMIMPSGFKDKFTSFQRLLIMRCLRPDKVVPCIQMLISESQGKKFVEPPPFDLAGSYADSTVTTPLIFVLSPGADPMNGLLAFAETKEMGKKIKSLSLGQGQGPIAEKMIIQGIDEGHWIVLQNCHLAPSWMAQLEKMCEELSAERAHPAFRLWLTAYPSNIFPVAVLQDGIKMTNEPPKGLKANLTGTYHQLAPSYFEDSKKQQILQRMHFGLAFFHASIQERRKYGALGWNIMYEFNESDLRICQMQLSLFIDLFDQVPIKALCYTAGETNYGGRVTDDYDRRTLMCMLRTVYRPEALDPNYKYTESGLYYCPRDCSIEGIKKYVASLPILDSPETYGLHANADITSARNETYAMFETMLLLQPRESSGGGDAAEDPLLSVANDILTRLPPNFNVLDAQEKYPTSYNESMNTVLTQELSRFNNLISIVRSSVKNVTLAIKGLVVMSSELEAVAVSMSNGQVPAMWAGKSYPSLKPLGSYVNDLIARINFFNKWIEEGPPAKFWISGFFFTQSFLTGTLQNYARKYQIAIDTLKYSFQVLVEAPSSTAPDGCYIYGLFLDGAAWDLAANKLGEALPKVSCKVSLFCRYISRVFAGSVFVDAHYLAQAVP
jgi:dynein heavy chain